MMLLIRLETKTHLIIKWKASSESGYSCFIWLF